MEIQVSERYKLTHDGDSWRVIEWDEGSVVVSGMYKGNHTTPKWKLLEKWWPHPSQAINYIIQQKLEEKNAQKILKSLSFGLMNN